MNKIKINFFTNYPCFTMILRDTRNSEQETSIFQPEFLYFKRLFYQGIVLEVGSREKIQETNSKKQEK